MYRGVLDYPGPFRRCTLQLFWVLLINDNPRRWLLKYCLAATRETMREMSHLALRGTIRVGSFRSEVQETLGKLGVGQAFIYQFIYPDLSVNSGHPRLFLFTSS